MRDPLGGSPGLKGASPWVLTPATGTKRPELPPTQLKKQEWGSPFPWKQAESLRTSTLGLGGGAGQEGHRHSPTPPALGP